ncbi:hypothetical protein GCM10018783_56030 [Streptomyces griseosporeus]|nr:hypothetical protein GCM10018783_56030 [Streptomyces griseosporeus]
MSQTARLGLRRPVSDGLSQAAVEPVDEPELDDELDDESEDDDEEDADDEEDVDFEAGVLLDDAPRLSLR